MQPHLRQYESCRSLNWWCPLFRRKSFWIPQPQFLVLTLMTKLSTSISHDTKATYRFLGWLRFFQAAFTRSTNLSNGSCPRKTKPSHRFLQKTKILLIFPQQQKPEISQKLRANEFLDKKCTLHLFSSLDESSINAGSFYSICLHLGGSTYTSNLYRRISMRRDWLSSHTSPRVSTFEGSKWLEWQPLMHVYKHSDFRKSRPFRQQHSSFPTSTSVPPAGTTLPEKIYLLLFTSSTNDTSNTTRGCGQLLYRQVLHRNTMFRLSKTTTSKHVWSTFLITLAPAKKSRRTRSSKKSFRDEWRSPAWKQQISKAYFKILENCEREIRQLLEKSISRVRSDSLSPYQLDQSANAIRDNDSFWIFECFTLRRVWPLKRMIETFTGPGTTAHLCGVKRKHCQATNQTVVKFASARLRENIIFNRD